ncbi:MAG: response regulator, partial [Deltaproteobacteria bacterium]|nr:response regulator [Deltaproteobacteria bacterium]
MAENVAKALIIDDENSIRDGCRQVLSRMGCAVDDTNDAARGLAMALGDTYDLILLDVQMPEI